MSDWEDDDYIQTTAINVSNLISETRTRLDIGTNADNERLRKQIWILKEALECYANEEYWIADRGTDNVDIWGIGTNGFTLAKKALKAFKEVK